jgi:hypothetical protein
MYKRELPSPVALQGGLFILSASVLALELLSMRVLSFMLWHHLAYMVLSVALLGFGASGAWLASSLKKYEARTMIVGSAILFAISNLLGFMLLCHVRLDTFEVGVGKLTKLGFYYAILLTPYFFAGLSVATIFREAGRQTTAFYFVNMVGSGVGCQLFMLAITPLGGPKAIAAVSLLGLSAALIWSTGGSRRLAVTSGVCLVAIAALFPIFDELIPVRPAPTKGLSAAMEFPGARIEFTKWTPLSRIDVAYADLIFHPFIGAWIPGTYTRTITIDGDASTWIFDQRAAANALREYPDIAHPELLKLNHYGLPFLIKDRPETLIIGVGGGNEIAVALYAAAKRVTGVELNSAILSQTTRYLRSFFGDLYDGKRAVPVNAEGRAFIRNSKKQYDIIQMSGVDTWSGLSSGAYVLGENYLYTVEAAKDFITHLKPDGILAIGRFLMQPPRETLRLVSNTLRALKEIGILHPENHLMVMSRGNVAVGVTMVKRSPFTRKEVDTYYDLLTKENHRDDVLWYAPYITTKLKRNAFTGLIASVTTGPKTERVFYDRYLYDVTPVYDNKPFFFEYYKWKNLYRDLKQGGRGGQLGANKPVGLAILLSLLAQVILFSLLFIFVPLLRLRKHGQPLRHPVLLIGGFGGIGLAYMLVEVGFMQKFVLFLGHPSYSISITLSAMLIGSGLGSLAVGRLPMKVEMKLLFSIFSIVAITFIYLLTLDTLFGALIGYDMAWRQAIAFALIALLAFPMGMPFPITLEKCNDLGPHIVPWALGINGAASVLGGVLCIIIAMSVGFIAVLIFAAALYLAALPCLLLLAVAASAGETATSLPRKVIFEPMAPIGSGAAERLLRNS